MGNKPGVRAGQGRMGRWLLVVWGLMALVLSGTPAMAAGPQVTAVVAGGNSTYALLSDGTVLAWGNNFYGQLGDGTTVSRSIPQAVPGMSHVQALVVGETSSAYALLSDGTVLVWGNNSYGQLGDGQRVHPKFMAKIYALDYSKYLFVILQT